MSTLCVGTGSCKKTYHCTLSTAEVTFGALQALLQDFSLRRSLFLAIKDIFRYIAAGIRIDLSLQAVELAQYVLWDCALVPAKEHVTVRLTSIKSASSWRAVWCTRKRRQRSSWVISLEFEPRPVLDADGCRRDDSALRLLLLPALFQLGERPFAATFGRTAMLLIKGLGETSRRGGVSHPLVLTVLLRGCEVGAFQM